LYGSGFSKKSINNLAEDDYVGGVKSLTDELWSSIVFRTCSEAECEGHD